MGCTFHHPEYAYVRCVSWGEKEQAYRACSPERLGTTLRQPDVIEFSLLEELREGPDRFFDRDVRIYSGAFKEVELFEAFEVFINVVNASAQVFWTSVCPFDGCINRGWLGNGWENIR